MSRFEPHLFPPNQHFAPAEKLLRAISEDMVEGDSVLNTAIDLPAPSFNRDSYCLVDDVLRGHAPSLNGIGFVEVKNVPSTLSAEEGNYRIDIIHDPNIDTKHQIENYAHTELRVGDEKLPFSRNRKMKIEHDKLLRDMIADRMAILKQPTPIP
jgi:hypothetical protein